LLKTLEKAGNFDLVYERYALWSFSAMEYAQAQGIPGILEVNAPLIEEQVTHRGLIDRHKAEVVTQLVFKKATVLIAVSKSVANYLGSYPQTQDKVHIVPNGVNPDRFPLHLNPTLPSKKFTVGFVGSMKPWHGLPILVDAFTQLHHRYPETRLLIVGDGPVRSPLEAHFTDHGMEDAVEFTGKIPPSQVPGYLASMDVTVAPYPAEQNFYFSPLKVYEYMAAGLPIVASGIGQIEAVIEDGINGLLYEPGNSEQLIHCLDSLRQQPELRYQLGKNARMTIVRSHTWTQAVQKILSLTPTNKQKEVTV